MTALYDHIPKKYLTDDKVGQILTVTDLFGFAALVRLYEKSRDSGKALWKETLSCVGSIGKKGFGKTKEGDDLTPVGDFGIITAFGIMADPGTRLPYIRIKSGTVCCGDKYYNRIIDLREYPHDCRGERMSEYRPQYDYGFFFDYNRECVPGKGFAVFFHCTADRRATAGCIAVSKDDMRSILLILEKEARIIID